MCNIVRLKWGHAKLEGTAKCKTRSLNYNNKKYSIFDTYFNIWKTCFFHSLHLLLQITHSGPNMWIVNHFPWWSRLGAVLTFFGPGALAYARRSLLEAWCLKFLLGEAVAWAGSHGSLLDRHASTRRGLRALRRAASGRGLRRALVRRSPRPALIEIRTIWQLENWQFDK